MSVCVLECVSAGSRDEERRRVESSVCVCVCVVRGLVPRLRWMLLSMLLLLLVLLHTAHTATWLTLLPSRQTALASWLGLGCGETGQTRLGGGGDEYCATCAEFSCAIE